MPLRQVKLGLSHIKVYLIVGGVYFNLRKVELNILSSKFNIYIKGNFILKLQRYCSKLKEELMCFQIAHSQEQRNCQLRQLLSLSGSFCLILVLSLSLSPPPSPPPGISSMLLSLVLRYPSYSADWFSLLLQI